MKNKAVRFLALLMSVMTLISAFSMGATSLAATYENDVPIVYVYGAGRTVYDKDEKNVVYPVKADLADAIMKEVDTLLSAFMVSVSGGNWDAYCDALVNVISGVYGSAALDKNGEASNGSHALKNKTPKKKTSGFVLSDYVFNYDSRLDPYAVAADLQTYIKQVMKATGSDKVQLVSRCLGCNIAAAYIARYGGSLLDSILFYVPAVKGAIACSEGFSGEIVFNADYIDSYVKSGNIGAGSEITELLEALVSVTQTLSILGIGTDLVQSIYDQIADRIVPELVLATYGTMPAYWSMVDHAHFKKAKQTVFGGRESEYAGLIKKINYYHENVMLPFEDNLLELKQQGVKVAIIAKYNIQCPPFFKTGMHQTDGDITVEDVSFGATTAGDIGKTFSAAYLFEAKQSGVENYISKDYMVDSSTCLFPDYTWFIKDMDHEDFSTCANQIMYEFLRKDKQLTIWNSEYCQFLQYDKANNSLSPVEASKPSGSVGDSNNSNTGNQGLLSLLLKVVNILLNLFKGLFGM